MLESLFEKAKEAWTAESQTPRHIVPISPKKMLLLYAWLAEHRAAVETAELCRQLRMHLGPIAAMVRATRCRTDALISLLFILPEAPVRFDLDRHHLFALALAAQEAQQMLSGPYEELGPLLATIQPFLPPPLQELLQMVSFDAANEEVPA